ncbi:uncharacterized protein [Gossypium hirsutum]|uniref:Endonuclease/exonuclease/phosphatase domain-containing protein n=1 Tax=Gossypium hirsutum TaxID=3635 RepID=A0A1U8IAF1_GOSHI|nr:uncharacterized protein LOC107894423 [Gossypium hirsutum]
MWNDLSRSVPFGDEPWMAIGDFNAILSPNDKKGGHIRGHRCQFFGAVMDKANLHDLGFQGLPFRWHRGMLSERLDRVVSKGSWLDIFPGCVVTHLPRIKSDHRPLLLNLYSEVRNAPNRPFWFLASWLKHHNFSNYVKENWSFNGNMINVITGFIDRLKNWNKCVYGHISQRKHLLMHKLSKVQNTMDLLGSNPLRHQEFEIGEELESILYHEEILGKQKSRCEWLKLRDRNTSYAMKVLKRLKGRMEMNKRLEGFGYERERRIRKKVDEERGEE